MTSRARGSLSSLPEPQQTGRARVLLVSDPYPPSFWGGAELYAHNLARRLQRRGHEVGVLTSSSASGATEDYTVDGVPVRVASTGRIHIQDRRVAALDGLGSFDVAHVHNFRDLTTTVLRPLRRQGLPIVWTLHDYWAFCPRINMVQANGTVCRTPANPDCPRCQRGFLPRSRGWASFVPGLPRFEQTLVRRDVIPHVAAFVAPSDAMRRAATAWGVPPERVVVVPNAADAQPASPPPGFGRVLLLGNHFGFYKGWPVAVDAFDRLGREGAPYRLDIVGRGDLARIRAEINRRGLKNVSVHGPVPHTAPWFRQSDLVLLPSLWEENCSLVALEALHHGRPLVATRVGGNPEIVQEGENGLLVPPGNPEALANAVRAILGSPAELERLAAGAYAAARARYGWEEHVGRIEEVYRDCLRGARSL